uniref:Uncharacterized protein n=1 Tax=Populus trichocarpa TaxID=3694 RepID=A0A2K1WV58_POPTR
MISFVPYGSRCWQRESRSGMNVLAWLLDGHMLTRPPPPPLKVSRYMLVLFLSFTCTIISQIYVHICVQKGCWGDSNGFK